MKEVSTEELKKIQLEILDIVTDFCDKNGIKYWLNAGTLLGAVRHKGYIPWDDDIDLGMERRDYKRFCELFNKNNTRYHVFCIENNKNYFAPYAKVADMDTELYEPDESGIKFYINVDIFPYDNAPDNFDDCNRIFIEQDRLRHAVESRRDKSRPSGNAIVRVLKYSARSILRIIPEHFFLEAMSKKAQRMNSMNSEYTTDFTGYTRYYLKKAWINNTASLKFEGKMYKVPLFFDNYLYEMYGDYMILPPVDKQKSHHRFVAFR